MRPILHDNARYLFMALSLCGTIALSQPHGGGELNPGLKTNRTSLEKWQGMRFGMFIHWGPVTLRGTEIGWSRGQQVSIPEYDSLYREFNPVLFSAKEWVSVAKAAGMKYLVITSKHHDGFCLWDSKYTDYTITHTPFRRDVLKELSEECAREGIDFCTYYSILDWHHPHYTTRYGGDPRPVENSDMNIYRAYLRNQVEELVVTYHTKLLWFDGQWEKSWTHEDGMELYSFARKLNDALLINNRVDKAPADMKGTAVSDRFAGDFGTPEQEVGPFDNINPWESCITICNQWAWKPNDGMKSLKECIHILARSAGGGGNLLLNVSPMSDGRIEGRQVERLKGIGNWLEKFGESIYGTRGGPYKPTWWFASTYRGNRVYLHLLKAPKDELRLPVLVGRRIERVRGIGGEDVHAEIRGSQIVLTLQHRVIDENDYVIAMDLDGPVEGTTGLEVPPQVFPEVGSGGIVLSSSPSPVYSADGARTLMDSVRGSLDHKDGKWLGFEHDDFEAVIDLHSDKTISKVAVGFLQNQTSWIFLPKLVEVSVSEDGSKFRVMRTLRTGQPKADSDPKREEIVLTFEKSKARYVKVKAANVGTCPDWHPGSGGNAWIFVDEISVE